MYLFFLYFFLIHSLTHSLLKRDSHDVNGMFMIRKKRILFIHEIVLVEKRLIEGFA
jgi:hypothetical protein